MPLFTYLLLQSNIIKQPNPGADLEQLRHLKALTGKPRNAKLLQYHLLMAN